MYTFAPILKEIIWGGNDLLPYKNMPADERKIGESWELSHVEGNVSLVANGEWKGKSIDELIGDMGDRLLGKKVMAQSGTTFPLLVKFIDARDKLSIQVHPDDALALRRHGSRGKTEMWYVVKAAPDAVLYSGFSQQIDAGEYARRVADKSIMDVLQCHRVNTGDVFFLPAGRVHAIGAGCFIAEIQQTSNITYRIYDYNRRDALGNERELHTELAKEAIDFRLYEDYRTRYVANRDGATLLASCPYFTTNLLNVNRTFERDVAALDSFIIYICIQGAARLKDDRGNTLALSRGQTALVPAEINNLSIETDTGAQLLETFVG